MKNYYKTLLAYCVEKKYLTDTEARHIYSKRMSVTRPSTIVYHTIDKLVK